MEINFGAKSCTKRVYLKLLQLKFVAISGDPTGPLQGMHICMCARHIHCSVYINKD